jgi:hypothetical protein
VVQRRREGKGREGKGREGKGRKGNIAPFGSEIISFDYRIPFRNL